MSNFTWTEDQTKAMNIRGKNILVSAAAGSGKTALLTERLKRLVLEDGVNCRNLLVLTFTRAAASEMKQRFKHKLFESLNEKELGQLTEKEVSNQINALTDSQISTIDSFAQSMVRRYFEILGIDPGFRIVEENELKLLIDETVKEVFEKLFIQHEENPNKETEAFIELVNIFGGELNNEGLKDAIDNLNFFFDTLANPSDWIDYFIQEIENLNFENFYDFKSLKPFFETIDELIERIGKNYQEIETFYLNLPWPKNGKSLSYLEDELNAAEELVQTRDIKKRIELLKKFPLKSNFRLPSEKGKTEDQIFLINELREKRGDSKTGGVSEIKEIQSQLANIDLSDEVKVIKELGRIFLNLVKLTRMINQEVDQKKRSLRILYFNDLERYLLQLLENDEVRENIQKEYQHIYLDEVQDTNGIQEAIIQKIENGNNRFMVGDVKQSIYRFRRADPGIIINNYHKYKKDPDSELILLNQNFRSSPEIINAVNSIFEKIMSSELGEIDYDSEAKLIATRTDHTKKPEIDLIIDNHNDYVDKTELQARYIAQKIQYLIETGQADYRDIGVLYRAINTKAPIILDVFSQEGVPVLFIGDNQQVDTIEISLFLKLLSLIDNHKQDVPLLALLELPLFNFSSDEMARIRITYPDEAYFYECVEKYKDEQEDELSIKLKNFYKKLDYWRNQSRLIELDVFLWDLMLESGFYNYFGNLNNGKERKENLRLLIEKAKAYKDSSLKGITSFLQYVSDLEKSGQSLTISGSTADSENVIRLMSIHKSKGLEFKVVIYADLNTNFKVKKKGPFFLNTEYGFGAELPLFKDDVLVKKDNLLNQSLATVFRKESLSEEMRLMYVAMTRAMDQLYVVANLKDINNNTQTKWTRDLTPYNLTKINKPIDWIMNSIFLDESFIKNSETEYSTNDWEVKLIPSQDVLDGTSNIIQEEIQEDEEYLKLKELVFNQMNKPEEVIVNEKPLKMSVSRIKHHSIAEEEPVELIPINKEEKGFSGSDIGTATHTILQRINLNRIFENPKDKLILEKEIQRLIDKGFISEEISKVINRDNIINFFNSELGKRYLKSFMEDEDNVLKENPFYYDTNKEAELNLGIDRPIELSGIIDVSFLEDNHWILIDYKTDRFYSKEQQKHRVQEYTTQINLYAKALEDLTMIPVKEKHLYFLSENKDVKIK